MPYMDMWDGYLQFYIKVRRGDWGAWWAQHNEHRILFSRLLFWLDIRYFNGLSLLLIPLNFLLLGLTWYALVSGAANLFGKSLRSNFSVISGALFVLICFSWLQADNIIWGFQSQFIAAYLFPLLAFQALARSAGSGEDQQGGGARSIVRLFCAIVYGVLSVVTMANGIIALPILTLAAILLRQSWWRVSVLGVVSVISAFIYCYGYHSPLGHGSLRGLLDSPVAVIQFLLVYLGSPFQGVLKSYVVSEVMGGVYLFGCFFFFVHWQRRKITNPMYLAFLLFMLYIAATGLGTACGRAIFGIEFAGASRYTTPGLLGWASLAVLAAFLYRDHAMFSGAFFSFAVTIPLLLLPAQSLALQSDKNFNNLKTLAALALDLGIHDKDVVKIVYPFDSVYEMARDASLAGISIFGSYPIKGAQSLLGKNVRSIETINCRGEIEARNKIDGERASVRVGGWVQLFDRGHRSKSGQVLFVDEIGQVVGVAVLASPRPDPALISFDGYIRADSKKISIMCRE